MLADRLGIKRKPALYFGSVSLGGPLLYGFIRPRIIIPMIPFTDTELRAILSHELTHYRRGDLWLKLAAVLARTLHWFNPLVHIAAARLTKECELSCDDIILPEREMRPRKVRRHDVCRHSECTRSDAALTTHFNPKPSAVPND